MTKRPSEDAAGMEDTVMGGAARERREAGLQPSGAKLSASLDADGAEAEEDDLPARPRGNHFKPSKPDPAQHDEAGEEAADVREADAEHSFGASSAVDDGKSPDAAHPEDAGEPVGPEREEPQGRDLPPLPELPTDPHEGLRRVRKKTHNKAKRRLKIAAAAVLVVAVLAGTAVFALNRLVAQGGEALRSASTPEDLQAAEDAETKDEGLTVEYQGKTYRYNENMVSIVVIGYDRRDSVETTGKAGQGDAIMVVAMDTETGAMRVIGIPRDTMVDVDEHLGDAFIGQDQMQIALAFSYGDGYDESSRNVVRAVSRVLYNVPMEYYFAMDMNGVGPLNDAVGGVTLTPIASIPNTSIVEGQQITLRGRLALNYLQYRDTSQLTSSLDRQARQVQYLQAFFPQAIASAQGNPGVLIDLYNTALEYSTTNLGLSEFSFLAAQLIQNGMSQLDVTTLQGEAVKGTQYVEFYPDMTSVYETVLDTYYTVVDEKAAEDTEE